MTSSISSQQFPVFPVREAVSTSTGSNGATMGSGPGSLRSDLELTEALRQVLQALELLTTTLTAMLPAAGIPTGAATSVPPARTSELPASVAGGGQAPDEAAGGRGARREHGDGGSDDTAGAHDHGDRDDHGVRGDRHDHDAGGDDVAHAAGNDAEDHDHGAEGNDIDVRQADATAPAPPAGAAAEVEGVDAPSPDDDSPPAVDASTADPAPTGAGQRFAEPIPGARITSSFGDTSVSVRRGAHTGIDFAGSTGTPIKAVADGTVVFAGTQPGRGNTIVIKHSGDVYTRYGHQSELLATEGQQVRQGDVIGKVGATGNVTGPHLHFEISQGGYVSSQHAVDPMPWVRGERTF